MKKTLLLLVALLSTTFYVHAQGFVFLNQGKVLDDGALVTFASFEDAFGIISCATNPEPNPTNGLMLKFTDGNTTATKATITITKNTMQANQLQWCMGGACREVTESLTLDVKPSNDPIQVQFDANDIKATGYLTAVLKVQMGLEIRTVNIEFTNGESAGINGQTVTKPRRVAIYDLEGRPVKGKPVRGVYIINDGTKTYKKTY